MFRITLLYTVEYLVLNIVISVGMAVWIGSLAWGKQLFRLVFFLPTFTPLIGIALVWLLMLTPGGFIDWRDRRAWLADAQPDHDPSLALQVRRDRLAVVALRLQPAAVRRGAGIDPAAYLDAAAIDGARPWQRFWRIKLPLISPSLFFGTVLTAITSLQIFDQVYALTRGGPGSATTTLGYAIYSQGFVTYRLGYASSIAWVLFAIIMALTALQLRLQRNWVHYDI